MFNLQDAREAFIDMMGWEIIIKQVDHMGMYNNYSLESGASNSCTSTSIRSSGSGVTGQAVLKYVWSARATLQGRGLASVAGTRWCLFMGDFLVFGVLRWQKTERTADAFNFFFPSARPVSYWWQSKCFWERRKKNTFKQSKMEITGFVLAHNMHTIIKWFIEWGWGLGKNQLPVQATNVSMYHSYDAVRAFSMTSS